MAEQKYTIEDILNEYDEKNSASDQNGATVTLDRMEMQKLLEQTTSIPAQRKTAAKPQPFRRANEQSKINRIKRERRTVSSRPDIETSRLAAFQTLELMREKVSFVNSAAMNPQTAPTPKNDRIEGYEGAVLIEPEDYSYAAAHPTTYKPNRQKSTAQTQDSALSPSQEAEDSDPFWSQPTVQPTPKPAAVKKKKVSEKTYYPQIRTMEDSTRAKEESALEETDGFFKKKKKLKNKEAAQRPYKWDSIEEQSRQKKEKEETKKQEASDVIEEDKPVFFDVHHAGAEDDDNNTRLSKEERQRQKRIAAIHRLRKKRMRLRDMEANEEGMADPVPNNESEIRANIELLGKTVRFRTMILTILFVLSLLLSIVESVDDLYAGLLNTITVRGYILVHLLIGGVAFGVSFPTVVNGMKRLFRRKSDADTMAAVPMSAALLGALASLFFPESMGMNEAHLFMPVGVFALLMNAVGKWLIIRRANLHLKALNGSEEHYVLNYVQNEQDAESMTRGIVSDYPVLVSMRKTKRMSDFLRYTFSSDPADHLCRKSMPILLIASVLIAAAITGIRSTVMTGFELPGFFLSVFSMILSGGCCTGIMLVANLPLFTTAKKMSDRKCALLGYQSVDEFYDSNALMVDAKHLFSEGTVTIETMKAVGDLKIEQAVLEAASLSQDSGSVLEAAFGRMVPEETQLYSAESVQYEEDCGLSGWIRNRRVLLGNREMMMAHNIEGLPSMKKEEEFVGDGYGDDVIYLSVSGVLTAMFLIHISPSNRVKRTLQQLMEEDTALVIRVKDSFLSQQRIAKLYELPENRIRVIPLAMQETFDNYTQTTEYSSASVITSGMLEDTAQLLLQARKIRRSAMIGMILQSVTVFIGLGVALVYIGLSAYTSVTSEMFLLFQMASCLITGIAARFK